MNVRLKLKVEPQDSLFSTYKKIGVNETHVACYTIFHNKLTGLASHASAALAFGFEAQTVHPSHAH